MDGTCGHGSPGPGATAITALVAFLIPLGVYLATAAPTVLFGDPGELQTVALTGGVAHPSGYPLFVLAGRVFDAALGGDPAHRITVMSAFFGAVGTALFALVLVVWGVSRRAALLGALFFAFTYAQWWASIRAEVYTLAVALYLLALLVLAFWMRARRTGTALGLAFLLGLTATGHLAFAPAIAVIGLYLAAAWPGTPGRRIAGGVLLLAAFIAGWCPYLYTAQVDRADHPVNYIDYTSGTGPPESGIRDESLNGSLKRMAWLVTGSDEAHVRFNPARPRAFARSMLETLALLVLFEFGPLGAGLAGLGAVRLRRRRATLARILLLVLAASFLFTTTLTSGRMIPAYFLPGMISVALLAGFGFEFLVERWDGAGARRIGTRSILVTIVLLAVALPHLIRDGAYARPLGPLRWSRAEEHEQRPPSLIPSLRSFHEARDYGERLIEVVPENALVIGLWKEIMVLAYVHQVEGARPDLTLDPVAASHLPIYRWWQDAHDLDTHPFVFTSRIRGFDRYFDDVDSVRVDGERWIYIKRSRFPPARSTESNP